MTGQHSLCVACCKTQALHNLRAVGGEDDWAAQLVRYILQSASPREAIAPNLQVAARGGARNLRKTGWWARKLGCELALQVVPARMALIPH
eukprot:1157624-Pelagomonas_calceolata.AAC.16